ncbi:MAG: hypothetical protein U5L05_12965 [Rubrivivax sp.]|nr:hypothetical protein [Rubrivivax sp.]
MKLLPSFVPFLRAHLGQVMRSLQASLKGWAPRPAPMLALIPIRSDHKSRHAIEHRRRRGV